VRELLARGGAPQWWRDKHQDPGHRQDRQAALRWLGGLLTREGNRRDHRVAHCGYVVMGVSESGRHRWVKLSCRDRACPSCQRQRSAELAEKLRAFWDTLTPARQDRCAFVTLTQPQRAGEDAGAAVDRLLATWRAMTAKGRSAASDYWHQLVEGSIRSIEVTKGSVGWHAHVHVIVELRRGVPSRRAGEIQKMWLSLCDDATPGAQDARKVDRWRVGQLTKYIVKPFKEADGVCRQEAVALFASLQGRRMLEGTGAWRSWQAMGEVAIALQPDQAPDDKIAELLPVNVWKAWDLAKQDRAAAREGRERVRIPDTGAKAWEAFWDAETWYEQLERDAIADVELLPGGGSGCGCHQVSLLGGEGGEGSVESLGVGEVGSILLDEGLQPSPAPDVPERVVDPLLALHSGPSIGRPVLGPPGTTRLVAPRLRSCGVD